MLVMMTAMSIASPAPGCAAISAAIGGGRVCAEVGPGVVIAGDRERADRLNAIARAAMARFEANFGRPVPTFAVVETVDGAIGTGVEKALATAGFAWRMPWLSEADTAGAYRASIERAVTAKAAAMGFDAARTRQMADAAWGQQADRFSSAALRKREAGALPHELAHGWFIHAYWPRAEARASDHYGGPAPDWMDEIAAVLAEDQAMADGRRAQFAAILSGGDAAAKARLLDLATFLSGGHPALPKLDVGAQKGRVAVLTGAEAAAVAQVAGTLYLQARSFADYPRARSGGPAAYRSAAAAFAGGRDTAGWLRDEGARLNLPTTIEAVERDWRAWVAVTPPPSPARG